jgi:hypothetical protein
MLIPFGTLAASGAGVAPAYELIATALPNGSTNGIFFEDLSTWASTYRHFQIRYTLRTVGTTKTTNDIVMRFQAEDNNYSGHFLFGTGSSVASLKDQPSPHMYMGQVPANSFTASAFNAGYIDILDAFSTTKTKVIRGLNGVPGTGIPIMLHSGAYFGSTAAITRIVIGNADGANFTVGSRASIYGIKG